MADPHELVDPPQAFPLDPITDPTLATDVFALVFDEALTRLASFIERKPTLVECRGFAGAWLLRGLRREAES